MKLHLNIFIILICFTCLSCKAQTNNITYCKDERFNALVAKYINFDIPVMSVQSLYDAQEEYLILDAREKEEYDLSHIPGAIYIGYENPDFDVLEGLDQSTGIVVYCSIGYRSEKIGVKLLEQGYTNVTNLYGSIFEWANQNLPLHDVDGSKTHLIHGYNKKWSQWIKNDSLKIKH